MPIHRPSALGRRVTLPLVAFAAFVAGSSGAWAGGGQLNVTISTAPTHDMAFSKGVYSPTGNAAVLNSSDLMHALAAGNVEITTGMGAAGTQQGDIDIEAAVHWVSRHSLALDAFHSIRVNQPVTDAGTGALAIETNIGGINGNLDFSANGNITFWSLANRLSIDGKSYTLVNNVASLAAGIAAAPDGNFALAGSYDASVDKTYEQSPIPTVFEGNLEGLGNTLANVSMHGGGFFYIVDWGATVSNLHLRDVTVLSTDSAPGGLASGSYGTLYRDDVSGTLIIVGFVGSAGGLVGGGSGSIVHCSSTATLEFREGGGLSGGAMYIGGLAGGFSGTILDSFSTADIVADRATFAAGGLVGEFSGLMRHSHATGNVRGVDLSLGAYGGLIGTSEGQIYDSYATGNIEMKNSQVPVGGLVGIANASIAGSFATGKVEFVAPQGESAGGLVGWSTASITNSYAIGAVGEINTGGLAGNTQNETGSISSSYSTGKVGTNGGGFSLEGCGCFSNDYWDTTTSGTTNGIAGGNASGITGYSTQQLQSGLPAGFDPAIWAQDRRINRGLPYLIANPPPQ